MGLSPWTFAFEIVNFVVLAFVLYRLFYRPLHQAIDRRREAVLQNQTQAEAERHEAAELKQEAEARIARMEHERDELLGHARTQAEHARQELLAAAQLEVQQRLGESQRLIETERAQSRDKLQDELSALAIGLAERLLQEAADVSLHEQLVRRAVEKLMGLTEAERQDVRFNWQVAPAARVEAAYEIDDPTRARIEAAIADILCQSVPVTVTVMPGLLAGARIMLGGRVWDSSLAAQLGDVGAGIPIAPIDG